MKTAMHIGAAPASIEAIGAAIVEIIKTDVDSATIQKALSTLASSASVEGVTVANSQFTAEGPKVIVQMPDED